MKTIILVLLLILLMASTAAVLAAANEDTESAAGPTFFRDVLPILQENCQTCHRPSGENIGGMLAPMTLVTYDDVRPWARSIARNVESRQMPPWFASDNTSGNFKDERRLSDTQIQTIVAWAGMVPCAAT